MVLVFYLFLAVGVTLVLMDATGQMRFAARTARRLRIVGVVAAAGPGLAPTLAMVTGRLEVGWPFPLIAMAYLGLFIAYAAAVAGWLSASGGGAGLRRTVYTALILLAALPSAALLVLTPFVALAGCALAQPLARPPGDAADRDRRSRRP